MCASASTRTRMAVCVRIYLVWPRFPNDISYSYSHAHASDLLNEKKKTHKNEDIVGMNHKLNFPTSVFVPIYVLAAVMCARSRSRAHVIRDDRANIWTNYTSSISKQTKTSSFRVNSVRPARYLVFADNKVIIIGGARASYVNNPRSASVGENVFVCVRVSSSSRREGMAISSRNVAIWVWHTYGCDDDFAINVSNKMSARSLGPGQCVFCFIRS